MDLHQQYCGEHKSCATNNTSLDIVRVTMSSRSTGRRLRYGLSPLLLLLFFSSHGGEAFVAPAPCSSSSRRPPAPSSLHAASTEPGSHQRRRRNSSSRPPKRKERVTLAELRDRLLRNPAQFQQAAADAAAAAASRRGKKSSKSRRTRRRVDQPQQTYAYAAQRKTKGVAPSLNNAKESDDTATAATAVAEDTSTSTPAAAAAWTQRTRDLARELGLKPAAQHCDPSVVGETPTVVGRICVGDDESGGSNSSVHAYLIEKPAGWSILGSGGGGSSSRSSKTPNKDAKQQQTKTKKAKNLIQRVQVVDEDDGSVDILEYNELDVLALMTPEEREEHEAGLLLEAGELATAVTANENGNGDEKDNKNGVGQISSDDTVSKALDLASNNVDLDDDLDPQTVANLRRIAARVASNTKVEATFAQVSRPSVVAWLKDWKAAQGTPIRGGNFWTAAAGASEVDDSGLVLLCPKGNVDNIFVEHAEYTAVVGNGGHLAPRSKIKASTKSGAAAAALSQEAVKLDVVSRLRKGRGEDIVQTVKVVIPERPSFCSTAVDLCQKQFEEGIRGDAAGSPFDRRAQRRLIHCRALSVSSLVHDECLERVTESVPDDIAVLSERRNHLEYKQGSFLGRAFLKNSESTTAYREINGAADGFPGWTVDRYGEWLFVAHDPKEPRGPLPSIHDGYTAGVYYLESNPDRSSMGTKRENRPKLLEGREAPALFPVKENGVTYLVSLNRDLSTGLFLDQRPQRAWLARNCCEDTRVLNCFSHTGAFSVAAAAAGASTVSLDLSKKWLDRFPEHLKANGIDFDENERHDMIYGDCFDWLARLAKRGEKYDIVILDPPSSSVGKKKKRWSIKNDMDELVALAAGLVKQGGLLWTTTNSNSIHADKFARLCRQGLDDAGIQNAKLERIAPMPSDFPSIGAQPVKNLVWRIP